MKIRSQVGMVLNLDKCIGCHTCSVTCKTSGPAAKGWSTRGSITWKVNPAPASRPTGKTREMEGRLIRKINGKLQPRMGNRAMLLGKIFANPHLPGIDDYYEPFDYDYQNLHNAPESKHQPIARPRSLITGQRMDKITSVQTGKRFWAASSKNAPKTRTSRTCRRRCTASSKTPS